MTDTGKTPAIAVTEIDLMGMLRRRWRLLVFGTVVGIALSSLYYATATRRYESSIEVLVGQRSSEMTNRGTITGASSSGDSLGEDQLATHMRLFIARKVLANAIEMGQLDQLPSFQLPKENGGSLVDHIVNNIEVERGGEGSAEDAMVLRVFYRASHPQDAAEVLRAIFSSYKSYIDSQDQDSSKLAVELIEAARQTHEEELAQADQEYRDYVSSVPVLLEGDKVRDIHKERLANMEADLNRVRTSLAESASRLEVIEKALAAQASGEINEIDQLALLSQKEVERLKFFLDMTRGGAQSEAFQAEQPMRQEVAKAHYNRLLDLIQKEKALSDTFGDGHPLVEAARNEMEITRLFIEQNTPDTKLHASKNLDASEMLATYVMLLRNDIAEMTKLKTDLLEDSAAELKLAKAVEADFMKGNALRAKVERAQERYNQVIVRLQELNLSRSYAGFSTDLLASAEVPRNPVWPNLPIVIALGLAGGIAVGLMLALTAELLDTTFGSVSELEQMTNAAVIAHVPRLSMRALRKAASVDSPLDPSLLAHHSPRSAEAEIFRVGRTSLMIANRKDALQTIMVTSPQPGDGKSTTISNMAISFAQTGKKVLLIDADMRRPVIAKLFGIEERVGLSDYLVGNLNFGDCVTTSAVRNLDVMAHGRPTAVPAELLESHRLSRLFQEACAQYDLVLVDAPPVLAVADPAIVAPHVDSVLLTVRVTKNGRSNVQDAVRVLHDIQVSPAAVIVNGIDRNVRKTYTYGGYSKGKYGYVGHYHKDYAARDGDEAIVAPSEASNPRATEASGSSKSNGDAVPGIKPALVSIPDSSELRRYVN